MNESEFIQRLESGQLRAAIFQNDQWIVQTEVKQEILNLFRMGKLTQYGAYVDKHTVLPREFTPEMGIRIVPGGSAVRHGAYIACGVVIMPPSYVNIGAYVDEGTMIDSHVLVGSCAQIGKRVHLSAGVQIGGVLEPIGERPVIIEDDVFVGAGSVIVEGIRVRKGAVIAPGVILSKATQIYDVVLDQVYARASDVPAYAVVVPGSRKLNLDKKIVHEFGLSLSCPIIVKYRDEKTNAALVLEEALR